MANINLRIGEKRNASATSHDGSPHRPILSIPNDATIIDPPNPRYASKGINEMNSFRLPTSPARNILPGPNCQRLSDMDLEQSRTTYVDMEGDTESSPSSKVPGVKPHTGDKLRIPMPEIVKPGLRLDSFEDKPQLLQWLNEHSSRNLTVNERLVGSVWRPGDPVIAPIVCPFCDLEDIV